jgi:L-ascorbate metabolism protein UlaG (beta-lactamase superfamily)
MVRFWQGAGLRDDRRPVLARTMRLTKLEHAAFVVDASGDKLYVDPGKFTTPITESAGTVAVVITHKHDDHWTPDQLGRIRDANPGVRFFGGTHAQIHPSIPIIDNVGVLVNDALFYGGDSFQLPDGVSVQVLAAPAAAPWMKLSEAMDFVQAIAPRRAFPTHEMLLSQAGKTLSNTRLAWATEQGGGEFVALEPGDTLDI